MNRVVNWVLQTSAWLISLVVSPCAFAAGPASPVADINQTHQAAFGSGSTYYRTAGNRAYFQADGFWVTDGTPVGTQQLSLGPIYRNHATLGDISYFVGWHDEWLAFLRTDGTSAGTYFLPSTHFNNAQEIELVSWNGYIYFIYDETSAGPRLARLNSSDAIVELHDFSPDFDSISGGRILLNDNALLIFTPEGLYRSDGTSVGTWFLNSIHLNMQYPGGNLSRQVGQYTYFAASQVPGGNPNELWRSDGTEAGTTKVADLVRGWWRCWAMEGIGEYLYFLQGEAGSHWGYELWRTRGTADTTEKVEEFPVMDMRRLGEFLALSVNRDPSIELLITNGSPGSACSVFSRPWVYLGERLQLYSSVGNQVYFSAKDDEFGQELWKSDGTTEGTTLVKDINRGPGSALPGGYLTDTSLPSGMVFAANDTIHGNEPWFTDGTESGTVLLRDINPAIAPGPGPSNLSVADDGVLFAASGNTNYSQTDYIPNPISNAYGLWRSDGTSVATTLVRENLSPGKLTRLGSNWFFSANTTDYGSELWRTDGTGAGTSMLLDIHTGSGSSNPRYFTDLNSRLYFSALEDTDTICYHPPYYCVPYYDYGVWSTDGTAEGTEKFFDLPGVASDAYPDHLMRFGDELCFLANFDVYFASPDGTNTRALLSGKFTDLAATDQWVFASSPEHAPGISGGSPETSRFLGLSSLRASKPAATNSYVYFAGSAGADTEVWRTDGTESGTRLVRDIAAGGWAGGPFSSNPEQLTRAGDCIYFTADDQVHGRELWKTCDTPFGASIVKDIAPGNAASDISGITALPDGRILFAANDQLRGSELWVSDGSVEGTYLLQDINPGLSSSLPAEITIAGKNIYFAATTDIHRGGSGRELWMMPSNFQGGYCTGDEFTDPDSQLDLAGGFAGRVKVSRSSNTTNVKFRFDVHQIRVNEEQAGSRVPETVVYFYILETPEVPCRLSSAPVASIPVPAGKVSRRGSPRPVKLKMRVALEGNPSGKYLLAIIDKDNMVIETNKLNNYTVTGPLN